MQAALKKFPVFHHAEQEASGHLFRLQRGPHCIQNDRPAKFRQKFRQSWTQGIGTDNRRGKPSRLKPPTLNSGLHTGGLLRNPVKMRSRFQTFQRITLNVNGWSRIHRPRVFHPP